MSPRKPSSEPSNPRKDAILKDYDNQMLQILFQICESNPSALAAFIIQAKLNRKRLA
jgi:hypothetical protein